MSIRSRDGRESFILDHRGPLLKLPNNNHKNQIIIGTKLGLRFSLSGLIWRKKAGELVLCFFLGRDAETPVENE